MFWRTLLFTSFIIVNKEEVKVALLTQSFFDASLLFCLAKIKSTHQRWVLLIFIYFCGLKQRCCGNSHVLVPFGTDWAWLARYWRLTAAGGRRREVDKAPRSILSENFFRAIKIGNRKMKHDWNFRRRYHAQLEEPEKKTILRNGLFSVVFVPCGTSDIYFVS